MIVRGGVYWFEPDPVKGSEQAGRRPGIVLSRDAINQSSRVVVIVPVTTFRGQRLYPSDVRIDPPEGGVTVPSVALGLHVRSVDRQRLGGQLGRLEADTLRQIERALVRVLDISPEEPARLPSQPTP